LSSLTGAAASAIACADVRRLPMRPLLLLLLPPPTGEGGPSSFALWCEAEQTRTLRRRKATRWWWLPPPSRQPLLSGGTRRSNNPAGPPPAGWLRPPPSWSWWCGGGGSCHGNDGASARAAVSRWWGWTWAWRLPGSSTEGRYGASRMGYDEVRCAIDVVVLGRKHCKSYSNTFPIALFVGACT
jgi:hypothetical protein